mgnify:CR=1 FL=1
MKGDRRFGGFENEVGEIWDGLLGVEGVSEEWDVCWKVVK